MRSVCQAVFPDSFASGSSQRLNGLVNSKLRQFACELRREHSGGASLDVLSARRVEMMRVITRIVVTQLGVPPTRFDWSFYNKDGTHHCFRDCTPLSFYAGGFDID